MPQTIKEEKEPGELKSFSIWRNRICLGEQTRTNSYKSWQSRSIYLISESSELAKLIKSSSSDASVIVAPPELIFCCCRIPIKTSQRVRKNDLTYENKNQGSFSKTCWHFCPRNVVDWGCDWDQFTTTTTTGMAEHTLVSPGTPTPTPTTRSPRVGRKESKIKGFQLGMGNEWLEIYICYIYIYVFCLIKYPPNFTFMFCSTIITKSGYFFTYLKIRRFFFIHL